MYILKLVELLEKVVLLRENRLNLLINKAKASLIRKGLSGECILRMKGNWRDRGKGQMGDRDKEEVSKHKG